ncbi:binding-protein-dependent transport systems inner membrane component [Paenibacillus vortex V453]|uniref:Binding-protein-dependent transport systems inner membrane component n=2 Tax=Paenibacillus TaxID=44249 RepID=A0A2R9SLZ5_9BACL|nr:carbohydrate ABC transporter permease [Paenibacillus glucanolyticus]AWP25693.1 sugar ABC transporter permease [Paenibacillus sp. Cedars]EFU38387.1 binding-protein-dependent transport systems inner membrane component [Paenibacillus vortex V453]ETT31194.1 binding-protein-dependent transport systems inner membrane component [Paenibacillus sp. FSL R5-808]MDH6673847.1 raffinose/stachyose/melibiose transport system permease protein [Paenibacillus sp. LBL]
MRTKKPPMSASHIVLQIVMVVVALIFLAPFYFLLVNSVKSLGDIMVDAANWPTAFHFDNYSKAWEMTRFPEAFTNSIIITVISNLIIALLSAMAAYRMVRSNTRFNRIVFMLFVSAMVIPFQSIMIPLLQVINFLGVNNSIVGLILSYLGLGIPLSVFLFHGFVKGIPLEIEEAATVDGASPFKVFARIVLPMLKPMMVTVIILNCLWVWNDYLLPSLILQSPELRTIPLATFAFFGQYSKQWDMALPALVLGITPIIIFFLSLQKYIVEGVAAGSVKG